jgi:CIC family chloride channel protein
MTIWLLRFCDHVTKYSSVQRAAFIGAIVGVAAWFVPALVGGGDTITQAILSDRFVVKGLLTIFLLRLLLGPWSYAAGTPGGIFAPLLVLGACSGALFAGVLNYFWPTLGLSSVALAVVGMAALFTASVRAPLTGVVLSVEMTGGDLTLGLLAGSLTAMVVAMLLNSEPIYETLKRRMLAQENRTSSRV